MWSNLGPQGVLALCWPSYPTLSKWLSHIQLGETQKPEPSLLSTPKATTQYHLPLKVANRTLESRRAVGPRGGIGCYLHHPNDKDSPERGHHGGPKSPSRQSISLTPFLSVFLSLLLKRLEDSGKTPPSHIPLSKPLVSGQKNGQMRHVVRNKEILSGFNFGKHEAPRTTPTLLKRKEKQQCSSKKGPEACRRKITTAL